MVPIGTIRLNLNFYRSTSWECAGDIWFPRRCVTDCTVSRAVVWAHFHSISSKVSNICPALKPWLTKAERGVRMTTYRAGKADLKRGVAFHQHILSSFVLVRDQIAHPSGIIEVQGHTVEHFYVLLIPLIVHRWSLESQLRPSSSIGRPKSFWQIAESKDPEKSGSRSCVFISVSLSSQH